MQASEASHTEFKFFQEDIYINYSKQIKDILPQFFTTSNIEDFYKGIENNLVDASIQDLLYYKESLNLSDWYYYLLIREAAAQIFVPNEQPFYESYQTVFSWLMLAKSGYKVQLNFTEEDVFLSVYTMDRLYNIPVKKHGMGWMVEISHYDTNHDGFRARIRSNFFLEDNDQPFSFKLNEQPNFSEPLLTTRTISFEHQGRKYAVGYTLDRSVLQLINTLPEMSVTDHIDIPLSAYTYSTLIASLQGFIEGEGLDTKEALEFLLSFTRTGFEYQSDDVYQYDNITFAPEETLYHRFSDCEDRSVLYAYLVKEMLDLNVILLDFDQHIAVGVLLEGDEYLGKPIVYNNNFYTFCEPTGPDNQLGLGEFPSGLREELYTVLAP